SAGGWITENSGQDVDDGAAARAAGPACAAAQNAHVTKRVVLDRIDQGVKFLSVAHRAFKCALPAGGVHPVGEEDGRFTALEVTEVSIDNVIHGVVETSARAGLSSLNRFAQLTAIAGGI